MKYKKYFYIIIAILVIITLFLPIVPIEEEVPVQKEKEIISSYTVTEEVMGEFPTTITVTPYPDTIHYLYGRKPGRTIFDKPVTDVVVGDIVGEKYIHIGILLVIARTINPIPDNVSWSFSFKLHYKIEGEKWILGGGKKEYVTENFSISGRGNGMGNKGNCTFECWILTYEPYCMNYSNIYHLKNKYLLNEKEGIEPKVTLIDIEVDHTPIYTLKKVKQTRIEHKLETKIITDYESKVRHISIIQYLRKLYL